MKKNELRFTKMQALGNDFVVIDGVTQAFSLSAEKIIQISDRKFGIGFDQLLLIEKSNDPNIDFNYRIFNADGGEVGQCGNGARCLAHFVRDQKLTDKDHLRVKTQSNILEIILEPDGEVSVNMGVPEFEPTKIPFIAKRSTQYSLETPAGKILVGAVSFGNPHCVIQTADIENAPVEIIGNYFNQHTIFPSGVNVGFMQILNRNHVQLRVFERGAGETLACGSGACAAVTIGQLWDLLDQTVKVSLPGGELTIQSKNLSTPTWLRGTATTVFEGSFTN